MSTQYDSIQAAYDEWRTRSIALIEHANVKSAVAPFIKDANVLDLACGSAFYSYDLLEWGAQKVVGVDISPVMIKEAQAAASSRTIPDNASINFKVADCMEPVAYDGGPFDLVFAAWLLNYAPSGKELVKMFRNVALNLKDGGRFVTVCPPGTQDPTAFCQAERDVRPQGSGGLLWSITKDVEDGIDFHVYCHTDRGDVNFDCHHLRQDVYEASARQAGFQKEIEWSATTVPEEFFKHRKGGASMEELESYNRTPHYGVLVLLK